MSRPDREREFMGLALEEALKGLGRTSPNPCVGAVIVKNNKVIASGYHKIAGTPHAEVHALRKAGADARGSTMYVTLEPCCHTGKTPPCSQAVVEAGIKRVVIGMLDPNPLVAGGGRKFLIDNGVEVSSGVLEKECRAINEPFVKFITTKTPLVIIKAGLSLDGRLSYQEGKSGWITGPQSSEEVHNLRNLCDAILVGRGTVDIDNPSLTTRLKDGDGRDPVRVIVDTELRSSPDAKVYRAVSAVPALVFCSENVAQQKIDSFSSDTVEVIPVPYDNNGTVDLQQILLRLGEKNITSLLVEGGGRVHSSFLARQLADKAVLFLAPVLAGNKGCAFTPELSVAGRKSAIRLQNIKYTQLGEDIKVEGDVLYQSDAAGRS